MTALPIVQPEREPLTEAEARKIGQSANRIAHLRHLKGKRNGVGSLSVGTANGHASLALSDNEVVACLSLLIEREAAFLASFNVAVEKPK